MTPHERAKQLHRTLAFANGNGEIECHEDAIKVIEMAIENAVLVERKRLEVRAATIKLQIEEKVLAERERCAKRCEHYAEDVRHGLGQGRSEEEIGRLEQAAIGCAIWVRGEGQDG